MNDFKLIYFYNSSEIDNMLVDIIPRGMYDFRKCS